MPFGFVRNGARFAWLALSACLVGSPASFAQDEGAADRWNYGKIFPDGLQAIEDDEDERRIWAQRIVLQTDEFDFFADNAIVSIDVDRWNQALGLGNALTGSGTRGLRNGYLPYRNPFEIELPSLGGKTFFETFSRELAGVFRSVYAENVVILRKTTAESFRSSSLYMHLYTGRIRGREVEMRFPIFVGSTKTPLQIRSGEIERSASGSVLFRDARFSTCEYEEPHYDLRTESITIVPVADGSYDFETQGVAVAFGDTPILPLPGVRANTNDFRLSALDGVRFGNATNRGLFFESRWSGSLDPVQRAVHEALGFDPSTGGRARWDATHDMSTKRGSGITLNLDYEAPSIYRGETNLAYRYDPGSDRGFVKGQPSNRNRWWVRTRNRFELGGGWRADLSFADRSDPGFATEFFERELKTEEEQDGGGYVRYRDTHFGLEFDATARTSRFDPIIERLPEGSFHLPRLLVADLPFRNGLGDHTDETSGLYLSGDLSFGQRKLRRGTVDLGIFRRLPYPLRHDELPRTYFDGAEAARLAGVVQVELPLWLGPVRFVPFGGAAILSHSDRPHQDGGLERTRTFGGARLTTELSRVHDDVFLHRVFPEVEFQSDSIVSGERGFFAPLGWEERQAVGVDRVTLALRNRLLEVPTQRQKGIPPIPVVDLDLDIDYFPGRLSRRQFQERWGNLNSMLSLDWSSWAGIPRFELFSEGEWNVAGRVDEPRRIADLYTGLRIQTHEDLRTQIGYRRATAKSTIPTFRDEIRSLEFGVLYSLSERFEFEAESRFDLEQGRSLDTDLVLRRLGHDFSTEVRFQYDPGQGNTSVSVRFFPRLVSPRSDRWSGRRLSQGLQSR
ncbi:MAG: hypothetical protein H6834_13110 [Planctomycetes bacterium]|nr:hypothetical protein [Planctomycetota bacterium]